MSASTFMMCVRVHTVSRRRDMGKLSFDNMGTTVTDTA